MFEYSVRVKTKADSKVVMTSMVTADLKAAKEQLASCKSDIANGKWSEIVDAELVMREVTEWCEMNTKQIDYKWKGN